MEVEQTGGSDHFFLAKNLKTELVRNYRDFDSREAGN